MAIANELQSMYMPNETRELDVNKNEEAISLFRCCRKVHSNSFSLVFHRNHPNCTYNDGDIGSWHCDKALKLFIVLTWNAFRKEGNFYSSFPHWEWALSAINLA